MISHSFSPCFSGPELSRATDRRTDVRPEGVFPMPEPPAYIPRTENLINLFNAPSRVTGRCFPGSLEKPRKTMEWYNLDIFLPSWDCFHCIAFCIPVTTWIWKFDGICQANKGIPTSLQQPLNGNQWQGPTHELHPTADYFATFQGSTSGSPSKRGKFEKIANWWL